MSKNKVLFILKRRHDYDKNKHSEFGMSTGLFNSAWYMHEMLQNNGVESKLVVVADNNEIDREVSQFKPTHVIIEALWVVPSKFEVLQKLHPKVLWIIRLHSDTDRLENLKMLERCRKPQRTRSSTNQAQHTTSQIRSSTRGKVGGELSDKNARCRARG